MLVAFPESKILPSIFCRKNRDLPLKIIGHSFNFVRVLLCFIEPIWGIFFFVVVCPQHTSPPSTAGTHTGGIVAARGFLESTDRDLNYVTSGIE